MIKINFYATQEWYEKYYIELMEYKNTDININIFTVENDKEILKSLFETIYNAHNEWFVIIGNNFIYDKNVIDKIIENIKLDNLFMYCSLNNYNWSKLNRSLIISINSNDIDVKIDNTFSSVFGLMKFVIYKILRRKKFRDIHFYNKKLNKKILNKKPQTTSSSDNNIISVPVNKPNINIEQPNTKSFNIILKKLYSNIPFSYVRFGDADYMIMLEKQMGNVIGSNNKFLVTENLQKELIQSHNILNENYLIGSILSTSNNKLYSYKQFLKSYNKKIINLPIIFDNMISAVALTESFYDDIYRFIKLSTKFVDKKVMFVGAYYHDNLKYLYGPNIKYFVKTPPFNSFESINNIYKEILNNINNIDTIIFSTGQTSRVIIKRLWESGYYNKTMLDVGSLSDYCILETECEKLVSIRKSVKKHNEKIKNNFKILKEYID